MTMMSGRPSLCSSRMTCGTRVLCPAAKLDTPRTWTSFSTACLAASAGVWKRGTDVHVEADVGIACGNDFGAAVVPVLSHFGNHDAGTAPIEGSELVGKLAGSFVGLVVAGFGGVNA